MVSLRTRIIAVIVVASLSGFLLADEMFPPTPDQRCGNTAGNANTLCPSGCVEISSSVSHLYEGSGSYHTCVNVLTYSCPHEEHRGSSCPYTIYASNNCTGQPGLVVNNPKVSCR